MKLYLTSYLLLADNQYFLSMLLGLIKQFTQSIHRAFCHVLLNPPFPQYDPVALSDPLNIRCEFVVEKKQNHTEFAVQTGFVVTADNGYCPGAYGQLMELPDSCMSRMSVSMGVLPTRRMKKSWEMRLAGTALRAGKRSRSRPKRWGCPGYCMRSYSVRATWAFSCRLSTWAGSVSPHASKHKEYQIFSYETRLPLTQLVKHDASKDMVMVEPNKMEKRWPE